jgi:hypothetical protein
MSIGFYIGDEVSEEFMTYFMTQNSMLCTLLTAVSCSALNSVCRLNGLFPSGIAIKILNAFLISP